MKNMISKFADSLLSREDLKRVKGGYGGTRMKCCWASWPGCSECVSIPPGSNVSCVNGAIAVNC